jgi:hypothetical protein
MICGQPAVKHENSAQMQEPRVIHHSRFLRAVRAFLVVARAGLEPATH